MELKLRECPFCGKEITNFKVECNGGKITKLQVRCENCNSVTDIESQGIVEYDYDKGGLKFTGDSADYIWNQRVLKGHYTFKKDGEVLG